MANKTPEQIQEEIEEAALMSVGNFGTPLDMWHPDHGQILKDGKPTPEGLEFFKEQLEPFVKTHSYVGNS